jgi:hypothetical protein
LLRATFLLTCKLEIAKRSCYETYRTWKYMKHSLQNSQDRALTDFRSTRVHFGCAGRKIEKARQRFLFFVILCVCLWIIMDLCMWVFDSFCWCWMLKSLVELRWAAMNCSCDRTFSLDLVDWCQLWDLWHLRGLWQLRRCLKSLHTKHTQTRTRVLTLDSWRNTRAWIFEFQHVSTVFLKYYIYIILYTYYMISLLNCIDQ